MKPILYGENEEDFETNGIGVLSDAIDCTVTESLNKGFELEMRYPIGGIHFDQISRRRIVTANPDPVTDPQPFRIYRIVKTSKNEITIFARHISYDLAGITVVPFKAGNIGLALRELKDKAVREHPFTFSTDMNVDRALEVKAPVQIWKLMGTDQGRILDVFGGEYRFDRFSVELLGRRGLDRGVSIRYGKNLISLEQDENIANCYTHVHPYWSNRDGAFVQLSDHTVKALGDHDHVSIMPLDLSSKFKDKPTEAQLRNEAEAYIEANQIGVPAVSWKIQFLQLEQTEEYKGTALLERVLLGDTVTVFYPKIGVSASARAVEVCYKPILERYENVTLGQIKSGLVDAVVSQGKDIQSRPTETGMQLAIKALTSALLGAHGGAVQLLDTDEDELPDTLYIADDPDPNKAVKVWRFNYEGWGASKNGYNGPFIMGATFDTGLLADFITAGVLKSADGETFYLDLTNGILKMKAKELSIDGQSVEDIAGEAASGAVNMTAEEMFNKLTDNGRIQGIKLKEGKFYVNAEVINAGTLLGMLLKAGKIQSQNGKIVIDLDSEKEPVFNSGISVNGLRVRGDAAGSSKSFTVETEKHNNAYSTVISAYSATGERLLSFQENFTGSGDSSTPYGCQFRIRNRDASQIAEFLLTGSQCDLVLYGSSQNSGPQLRAFRNDSSAGLYLMMDGSVKGMLCVDSNGIGLQLPGRDTKYVYWAGSDDGAYTLAGK